MESVLEVSGVDRMASAPKIQRQQMPLSFLKAGEQAFVLKVRGDNEVHHHLENLGFVSGAPLKIVSEHGGNIIVEVKGAQVALDRSAAKRIITYQ